MPFSRKRHAIVAISVLLIFGGLASYFWPVSNPTYDAPARKRIAIHDGQFEAVVRTTGSLFFAMPGQSGDRSGIITIYAMPSKQPCGTASVHMVGNFTLDWEDDGRIVTLDRPRRALWDLDTCSIRFFNLYP